MYKTRSARPGQVLQARQSLVPRAKYVEVIDNNKLKKAVEQQGYKMYKNLLFADTTEVYTASIGSTRVEYGADTILRSDRSGKLLELNQIVFVINSGTTGQFYYSTDGSSWIDAFSVGFPRVGTNYVYVTRGEGTSMIFSLRNTYNPSDSRSPVSLPTLYTTDHNFFALRFSPSVVTVSFIYRYYQISTSL